MATKLPPLNALKAFESAARHGSFSAAATELAVTQGAISKQIKILESYLEVSLFTRMHGGIQLTEQGKAYFNDIGDSLDRVAFASARLREQRQSTERLKINVIPSFAALWLIPRLRQFQEQHPTIEVDIETGDGKVNFADTDTDCAIRCLHKSLAPKHALPLRDETLLCVASPTLAPANTINNIRDLLGLPLIPHNTRPQIWHDVLSDNQADASRASLCTGFDHFFLSVTAAQCGLGVGLEPDFLVAAAIAKGELYNALELSYTSPFHYCLLSPGYKVELHRVQVFYRWLLRQLAVLD